MDKGPTMVIKTVNGVPVPENAEVHDNLNGLYIVSNAPKMNDEWIKILTENGFRVLAGWDTDFNGYSYQLVKHAGVIDAWLNHPMAKFFGCNEPIKVQVLNRKSLPVYGTEQGHLGISDTGWRDTEYLVKRDNGESLWVSDKYLKFIPDARTDVSDDGEIIYK